MSFDPFDPLLYTKPITEPVVESVEPIQETSAREWTKMEEPDPDVVDEILDHYKNLTLTDSEVAELRADLANRNSMDLTILYDELRKLHARTSEDPKDQLFLDVIREEIESRGPNTIADARAERRGAIAARKQAITNERERIKRLTDPTVRAEAIIAAKAAEEEYQKEVEEFYKEWEHIKHLGFEFDWLKRVMKPKPVEPSVPASEPSSATTTEFKPLRTEPDPLPVVPDYPKLPTSNLINMAKVPAENLDINADPEAQIITKKGYDYADRKNNRDIDNSRTHPGISDRRVDKEELLNAMREATLPELNTLLNQYESLQEQDNNDEIVKEVIAVIQEAIISKVDLD